MDDGLGAEGANRVLHLAAHGVERRAAHERRREVDLHALAVDADAGDDPEVDDRDHGDLRVGDLRERAPHGIGRHHRA